MTAIRKDILSDQTARDQFLRGVVLLDQEFPGATTQDLHRFLSQNFPHLSLSGADQPVSTYDIFVFWHYVAMGVMLDVGNAAHNGPIFLPWHRMYLIKFEQHLQRVLQNTDFGLPYWDWAEDGKLSSSAQRTTALWTEDFLGESRGNVSSGHLADMQVRLRGMGGNRLESINPRPIQREAGVNYQRLPRVSEVEIALNTKVYDQPPWNGTVEEHRNLLEGWWPNRETTELHNRVHVWVGGDMFPGTSPNDPVFFLNHCNVDRVWEAWMNSNGRDYRPGVGEGPQGHRIDDLMVSIIGDPLRPQDLLDPSQWYSFDDLVVS